MICAELIEMLDPDLRSFALMRRVGQMNADCFRRTENIHPDEMF